MGFLDLGKPYSDISSPKYEALANWTLAGGMAAAMGFVAWHLSWPPIFDINDPEFNPLIVLPLMLIAASVFYTIKGVRWMARHKRFGAATMEIDGPVPAPLGRRLSGRIIAQRPPKPTGDYIIRLQCFDIHEMNSMGSSRQRPRNEEFPVWSDEIRLPASTDATKGLRFAFQLPASAGAKFADYSAGRQRKYNEFKFAITIPGLRRIYTKNSPPVGRRWQLDVSAPTSGANFHATFIMPVELE